MHCRDMSGIISRLPLLVHSDMSSFVGYVKQNFSPNTCILEIGAGFRSTSIFSSYFRKLYSIEADKSFIGHFKSNYIHIPIDSNGWYKSKLFNENLPDDYDILILDGPKGGWGYDGQPKNNQKCYRFGFCLYSWNFIKKGVPIIIDDIHREWWERDIIKFLKYKGYRVFLPEGNRFAICIPTAGMNILLPGVK